MYKRQILSIISLSIKQTEYANALSLIISLNSNLFFSDSFLESLIPEFINNSLSLGNITEATTTGPAKHPLPASSIPTSTTALGDLPLPNDYKISIRDQLSVILSGSKEAILILDLNP